jgi:hypothetical protein
MAGAIDRIGNFLPESCFILARVIIVIIDISFSSFV